MYNLLQKHKILAIIVGIVIALLGFFTLTLIFYTKDNNLIAKGIVLEVPIGNLRIEEAKSKLEQIRTKNLARTVHFTTAGKDFSMSMKELGLTFTYDAELQQAYQIGRSGNLFKKALSKFEASMGITFELQYHWDNQLLAATLRKTLSDLNIPAKNASFTVTSKDNLEIVPEKYGKEVDIDSLMTTVKQQLPHNQTRSIPIPFKKKAPDIMKTSLENLKMTELGSYTTHFNPSQLGRTQNIKLAVKAIDGTILKPEEVFSFNQIVGPRTVESGYQTAIIIEGDKFVPGLGGGVCQVSSTLYNAVQQASLSVVERTHHSLTVTYVPQGQDATVAYPNLDFKFKNDSGSYLLIHSDVSGNALTFTLYGKEKRPS